MKTNLRIKMHFDAAHRLESYLGKCNNLHGHRWDILFEFSGRIGKLTNMIIDFSIIKPLLEKILPDHLYLNEFYAEKNPTAECIAQYLFSQTEAMIKTEGLVVELESIELFESPNCSVIIRK